MPHPRIEQLNACLEILRAIPVQLKEVTAEFQADPGPAGAMTEGEYAEAAYLLGLIHGSSEALFRVLKLERQKRIDREQP